MFFAFSENFRNSLSVSIRTPAGDFCQKYVEPVDQFWEK